MRRRSARVLVTLALLGAAGCQDYNFNPVDQCYIQPGTKRVRLADVATADILFVVDESGSMAGEQSSLASNFDFFVDALNGTNLDRVSRGLDPIDFHIAVTTTSVYLNISTSSPPISSCSTSCTGATGAVCCLEIDNTPLRIPKECPAGNECGGGYSCRTNCDVAHTGEALCCDGTGAFETRIAACRASDVGQACGDLHRHYLNGSIRYGQDVSNQLYPRGDFIAAPGNPRVLHFDDSLYVPTINQPAIDALLQDFRENAVPGTDGSGQEQGFQAARLAIQKAIAGQQPGVAAGEWPHPNSKLVVAFIGDEDDCSGPDEPGLGVVIGLGGNACTDDTNSSNPRQWPVSDFSQFLVGLGRPLGTAFIVSAHGATPSATCEDFSCVAGQCCGACGATCTTSTCGGQQAGTRMLELRDAIGGGSSPPGDIVAGSICDPSFGTILQRVAEIVKPPDVLDLPSAPATSQVTVLRVVDKSGLTRKTCRGPAPAGLTSAQATAQGYDWWFVAARTGSRDSVAISQFVFVNHATNNCEANPGETYSADYLGVVPPSGCTTAADCAAALGAGSWTCEILSPPPAPGITGTCLCGA